MKRDVLYLLPKDIQIEIIENIERKDHTASELVKIQKRIQNELKKFNEQGKRTDLGRTSSKILEEVDHGTIEVVAKIFGESHETTRKRYKIVESAKSDPETFGDILEDVDSGKTSISHAHTKIKRRQKHIDPPSLPEGTFDVIYADPPWKYYLPLRGAPDAHYKTMSAEEICNLEVEGVSIHEKIADDAILFLWTTNPQLKIAFKVLEAWGFTYVTNMVWVKDKWGTGYYVRGQHELLLIAKKGKIPPPIEEVRPSSVLHAPVRKHSMKPDEIYGIIETMYPNRRYLELFARKGHKGWVSWGLEANG